MATTLQYSLARAGWFTVWWRYVAVG